MKKLLIAVALCCGVSVVKAEPVSVNLGENTFILPLQVVQGVQLYSPELGKGFPGLETVLVKRGDIVLSAGAAPVLGTSVNVPFVALSTKLSPRFFDTSNNDLYFGVWAGRASNMDREIFGISCSVELW